LIPQLLNLIYHFALRFHRILKINYVLSHFPLEFVKLRQIGRREFAEGGLLLFGSLYLSLLRRLFIFQLALQLKDAAIELFNFPVENFTVGFLQNLFRHIRNQSVKSDLAWIPIKLASFISGGRVILFC
jgi:hypothetical protein